MRYFFRRLRGRFPWWFRGRFPRRFRGRFPRRFRGRFPRRLRGRFPRRFRGRFPRWLRSGLLGFLCKVAFDLISILGVRVARVCEKNMYTDGVVN